MKTLSLLAIFFCMTATNCNNSDKECAMKSLESNQLKLQSFQQDIDSLIEIRIDCYRKIRIIFRDTLTHSIAMRINPAFRSRVAKKEVTKQANLSLAQKDSLRLIFKQLNDAAEKIAACNDSVKQIKIRINKLKTACNITDNC